MKTITLLIILFIISCAGTTETNTFVVEKNIEKKQQVFSPDTLLNNNYCWLAQYEWKNCLLNRINCPDDFVRTTTSVNSFADWLRHIPLFDGRGEVHLYNGSLKYNQNAHHAIVNIDVGDKDLQQCADAVMRLRAEYLFSLKKYHKIQFKYTSGNTANYKSYCEGKRLVVKGNKVSIVTTSPCNPSDRKNFMNFMQSVFNYCGTLSLSKELKKVESITEIKVGDVFIVGGSPGHAVIVLDVAINNKLGDKVFLIAQSYMPAQQIHILVNPLNANLSPWYSIKEIADKDIVTPEWTFTQAQLMRFED